MCCDNISMWLCCCGLAGVDVLWQHFNVALLLWSCWCRCVVTTFQCDVVVVVLLVSMCCDNISMWRCCCGLAGVDVLWQHFNVALLLWSCWCRCVVTTFQCGFVVVVLLVSMCCDNISMWRCCCGLAGVDVLWQHFNVALLLWSCWCRCVVTTFQCGFVVVVLLVSMCCDNISMWRCCCGLAGVDVLGHSSSQGVTTNILMWPWCSCLVDVNVLCQHFNVALVLWSCWCWCVGTQLKPRRNNENFNVASVFLSCWCRCVGTTLQCGLDVVVLLVSMCRDTAQAKV